MFIGKRKSFHNAGSNTVCEHMYLVSCILIVMTFLPGLNDNISERLLREEIDLEVSLRLRFLETIESRFYWALILRENLKKHL